MNDVEADISADECTTSKFSVLNAVDEDGNANIKQTKKNNKKKKNKKPQPTDEKPSTSKKSNEKGHLLGELNDQNDSQAIFRNDVSKCPHCDKMILKISFQMHEMHCSKINAAKVKEVHKVKNEPAKPTPKSSAAKSSKVKKNPIETADTDDFDQLLEMFQKSNDICNFKGCKVLTKTLGQNCEYCPNRFCLKHSMAEIHGCGDAAKKQARDHIKKDGNLDVRKKQSYSAGVKHKIVEKNLKEKIKTMQDTRTNKNKKDGK